MRCPFWISKHTVIKSQSIFLGEDESNEFKCYWLRPFKISQQVICCLHTQFSCCRPLCSHNMKARCERNRRRWSPRCLSLEPYTSISRDQPPRIYERLHMVGSCRLCTGSTCQTKKGAMSNTQPTPMKMLHLFTMQAIFYHLVIKPSQKLIHFLSQQKSHFILLTVRLKVNCS